MRGDLLFWPSDGSLTNRVITWATKGPFTHVSVDLGDGYDIGATSERGVVKNLLPSGAALTRYSTAAQPDRIEIGIHFLSGEIGNKYGYVNILNAVLKLLRLPYRLSRLDRYDCSSLVTRYLEKVGVDAGDLGEEPDSVSPNDLARWLGIIS